jgi:hypothetical protein
MKFLEECNNLGEGEGSSKVVQSHSMVVRAGFGGVPLELG